MCVCGCVGVGEWVSVAVGVWVGVAVSVGEWVSVFTVSRGIGASMDSVLACQT